MLLRSAFCCRYPGISCHSHSCHVSLCSPSSRLRDRRKHNEAPELQVVQASRGGGQRKAAEDPVAGEERGPAVVMAPEGKCGCQRGRRSEKEGAAVDICGPLWLRDRPEAPARLPGRGALLQYLLRANQVDPGWEYMAQISEQKRSHGEARGCSGWDLHVGKRENSR